MRYKLLIACLAWAGMAYAQNKVTGRVQNSENLASVENVYIRLLADDVMVATAISNPQGYFQLEFKGAGKLSLQLNHISYEPETVDFSADSATNLVIFMNPIVRVSDEVVVTATRVDRSQPTTFSTISRQEILKNNVGQDLPYLLNGVPGAVVNSDAGGGIGYTGIRIRGTASTRINVTINGIPVNDAESHGVFWVNMPDFASSVQNIQVQRGVGTSTNGAGAFGATISLQTNAVRRDPFAEVVNGYGSFNTWRNSVILGTGLLEKGWSFEGRLSRIVSDGFVDRAASNLQSYYLSGAHYGKRSVLKMNVFSGHERTYQAWNGVPEPRYRNDRAGMEKYASDLGLDTTNLFYSDNKKYNQYTYANQVDDYRQTHYQLHYSYQFNSQLIGNVSLHYTKGSGFYEEYKNDQELSSYGLPEVITGLDTTRKTDLVRRRWLDNDFYGTVYSLTYQHSKKLQLIAGGGYNIYDGDHFGEVTWARFASSSEPDQRYYQDNARKTDLNFYAKSSYAFTEKLQGFLDLQYRVIDYTFDGFDSQGNPLPSQVNYRFFNPKAGLVYFLKKQDNIYLSYSQGHREPVRNDIVESTPGSRPTFETLHDFELGYRRERNRYFINVNAYLMVYNNQLILTGKINDVGAYNNVNVPESYRAGVEAEASVNFSKYFQWNATLALSDNRIASFKEYIDEYDASWEWIGQNENSYTNTQIAFSPQAVASSTLRFKVIKGMDIDFVSKYVSRQYLDNTGNKARSLDAFFVNDLRLTYSKMSFYRFSEVRFSLLVSNLFDIDYAPNGYSFSMVIDGTRSDYNYLFPQAGRNALAQVTFAF